MNGTSSLHALVLVEMALNLLALSAILWRRQGKNFRVLCFLLLARIASTAILLPIYLSAGHGIEQHLAYRIYFYGYYLSFAVKSILGLLLIYSLFNLSMAPLDGLKRLGSLVFRWVAAVSLIVAGASVFFPHPSESSYIMTVVMELQKTQSLVTLCLLIFVCFAIRPLGLSFSSRIFGVSLGLGLLASANLVISSWMGRLTYIDSVMDVAHGVTTCAALLLWTAYFVAPEAKRRIIVLPTTSPFLRWNQIAQALGDPPGFVAIAGVPPELFAPAELEVMRRASLKMQPPPRSAAVPIGQSQTA